VHKFFFQHSLWKCKYVFNFITKYVISFINWLVHYLCLARSKLILTLKLWMQSNQLIINLFFINNFRHRFRTTFYFSIHYWFESEFIPKFLLFLKLCFGSGFWLCLTLTINLTITSELTSLLKTKSLEWVFKKSNKLYLSEP
jgi:hypothetical protein